MHFSYIPVLNMAPDVTSSPRRKFWRRRYSDQLWNEVSEERGKQDKKRKDKKLCEHRHYYVQHYDDIKTLNNSKVQFKVKFLFTLKTYKIQRRQKNLKKANKGGLVTLCGCLRISKLFEPTTESVLASEPWNVTRPSLLPNLWQMFVIPRDPSK